MRVVMRVISVVKGTLWKAASTFAISCLNDLGSEY
jgi:hypothetical protein